MKNLITTFAVFIFGIFFTVNLYSQSIGDYRTAADGDWSQSSTWEVFNGATWDPAGSAPTGSESITVDDSVLVDAAVSITDTVTVEGTGKVSLGGGSLTFDNGSIYNHARNDGEIPSAIWNAGSTCLITGVTGNTPDNSNQDFYNFTWNCPSQGSNLDVSWSGNTIGGTLTVENSASSQFRLTSSGDYTNPITINGDVVLSSGVLTATGSSTAMAYSINVNGNINVSGGSFALSRGSGGEATWTLMGDLTIANAELRSSNPDSKFVFTVDNDTQDVSFSSVSYNGTVNYVIDSSTVVNVLDGPDTVEVAIEGFVENKGEMIATGTVSFEDGSVFRHMRDVGTIPTAIWRTGSTLEILGVVTDPPDNGNQNFYNVVWNCPDQTGNENMGWDGITIGGDITILSTGAGRWQLCAPTFGNSATVDIMGDITQTEGNFSSNGTGNGNTTIVINVFGDVNVSGGNFSVSRGSQSATGTVDWNLFGQNFIMSDATTQNSNPTGAKFIFAGNTTQNLVLTNVTMTALPIEVDTGAILNVGTVQLTGSGIFTLNSGATLETGNEGGLDSTIQNSGTQTLSPEANYTFNGTSAQITGAKLPSTVNDLNISNTAGVTLTADVQVEGFLNVDEGDLDLNGNTATIGSSAELNETPGNTVMGNGKIMTIRDLNSPTSLNVGGLGAEITSAANLGSTLVERYNSIASGGGNQGIERQFNISPANNSGLNAALRFHYDESELNGIAEGDLILFRSADGSDNSWEAEGGNVNTTDNYIELLGIDGFSYWTAGDVNNPVPVELTSFSAAVDGHSVTLNWTTSTEIQNRGWDIERKILDSETAKWEQVGFVKGKGDRTEPSNYSFIDADVKLGSYNYRIKQLDFDGSYEYSQVVEAEVIAPEVFALHQNYPNPFNPETTIKFELAAASFVNISVYNALGQKVATLINEKLDGGVYNQKFDGKDFTSGVYIYRLTTDAAVFTKKMMLVK